MSQIASATVRRKGTFLEQERWRTLPWSSSPESKTNSSKLLDIMAKIPSIIQATDETLEERVLCAAIPGANHGQVHRKETPSTVPVLQQRLESISIDLALWRSDWIRDNAPIAPQILDWALFRTGDDIYRPGIYGAQGPDVYGLNMSVAADLNLPFTSTARTVSDPPANTETFSLMQDAALYITVVIWVGRLRKNLAGAAHSPRSIDFYNAPFYTECRCYYAEPEPSRLCQVFPHPSKNVEATMAWNIHAPRISGTPIRIVVGKESQHAGVSSTKWVPSRHRSDMTSQPQSHHPEAASATGPGPIAFQNGRLLLPGDVRFSGQLRILSWLVKRLSVGSRASVLSTLAAMGLSHCVHDVRPSEGNESIAATIRETMASSGFESAADFLLRSYR